MRPAITILFVMLDRTVRADFSGGSEPTLINHEMLGSGDDLVMSVETALLTSGRTGSKVYIISTEVWTQTLQLPVRAIRGLTEDQLHETLAHEAEAVSGIEASQSALAYQTLSVKSAEQLFWVSQISTYQLERLEEAVKHNQSRLAGVLHPTGLIRTAKGESSVELWPGVISGHGEHGTQVMSMDPKLNDWQVVLQPWLTSHAVDSMKHLAASSDLIPPISVAQDWQTLDQDESLQAWLTTAVRVLSDVTAVPRIRPQKKPVSSRQLNVITAIACGVTIMLCALHFVWIDFAERSISSQAGDARQISTQITQAKRDLAQLKQDEQQLQTEVRELSQSRDQMRSTERAHRQRWAQLLRLLAQNSPADLVVQNIDYKQDQVVISGICLEPQLANQLAAGLTEHLAPYGWRVQPPEKKALERLRNGGPWSYQIVLENVSVDPGMAEQALAAQQEASP